MAVPILASFVLSFTDFGIGNLRDWFSAEFVGLDNYTKLFGDEQFLKAASNTAVFVLVGVPLTIAAGLLAAVGLNQAIGKLRGLFRVGYYLPVVTSIVAIAVVWRLPARTRTSGLVNAALEAGRASTGRTGSASRSTALASIIALGVWRNIGFDMVVFLAALQSDRSRVSTRPPRVDGARQLADRSATSRCRCCARRSCS